MPLGQGSGRIDEGERKKIMELMKRELARELGVCPPPDGYWGGLSTRVCGQIGARLRHRLRVIVEATSMNRGPLTPGDETAADQRLKQRSRGS